MSGSDARPGAYRQGEPYHPTVYWAGAPYTHGTNVPRNVMGECGHLHRTPGAAQACIDRTTQSMQESAGNQDKYCDRLVMAGVRWRTRGGVREIAGTAHVHEGEDGWGG